MDRDIVRDNVLTASEAAELLGLSRPRLQQIMDAGDIMPLKKDAKGTTLFFRSDLIEYQKGKSKKKTPYLCTGSTSKCVDFFKKNRKKLAKVNSIFVFFDRLDAAKRGYYQTIYNQDYQGRYFSVMVPLMVLRDSEGQEMWLQSCNCGYRGEGPRGTKIILKSLIDAKELFGDDLHLDDLEDLVSENRVLKIFRSGETAPFDVLAQKKSAFEEYSGCGEIYPVLVSIEGKLALLEEGSFHRLSKGLLNRFSFFLGDVVEVRLYPKRLPFKSLMGADYLAQYNCILEDEGGRQVWLRVQLDETKLDELFDVFNDEGFYSERPSRKELFSRSETPDEVVFEKRDVSNSKKR